MHPDQYCRAGISGTGRILRQMILSVCRQTYKNWELCMTVSDEERHRMEEILEEDEFKEKAIHLIGISENRGISEIQMQR